MHPGPGPGPRRGRLLRLVAVSGVLATLGCGGPSAPAAGDNGVPPAVQESNQAMQDFMKASKPAKGAKR